MKKLAFFLILAPLWAYATGSDVVTVSGRLLAPNGDPVSSSSVSFHVAILDPTANACPLREEAIGPLDMSGSNGFFELKLGTGSATGSSLRQAFSNATTFNSLSGCAGGATTYTPSDSDGRKLKITFDDGGGAQTLDPIDITSVPFALSAQTVGGVSASELLKVNNSGSQVLTQSNLENIFSSSNYPALTALLSGSSGLYSKAATNGTAALPILSSPSSPSQGQMWYDSSSNQIMFYNGSSTQTVGTAGSGGTVTSVGSGTGLTGGPITTNGTLSVDVGTSPGQIVQVQGGGKLPGLDGSLLTNLNGSEIKSGTIGGTTAVSTSGNLQTSGNITAAGNASFTSTSSKQLSLYDDPVTNTNYITLKTPVTGTLTSDYTLTLPQALPASNGQILTSDTSGVLSWSPAPAGSVASVTSAGLPIVISGTASAPVVGVLNATTAASGVVKLAVSGGTTAGTVVQADDARLSDSRAPNGGASGDLSGGYPGPTVVALKGKGVTYTSISTGDVLKYDGVGWVNAALSSASLSDAGDLLKASNMPGTCAADKTLTFLSPTGTWTCSNISINATAITSGTIDAARLPASATYWQGPGSDISYNSGNVGIGILSPGATLHIFRGGADAILKVESNSMSNDARVVFKQNNVQGFTGYTSDSPGNFAIANNTMGYPLIFRTNNDGTGTLEKMRIQADGTVGIGTTTPLDGLANSGGGAPVRGLDIQGNENDVTLRIMNTGSSTARFPNLNITNYGAIGQPNINLVSARGSYGSPINTVQYDPLGGINAFGYNGTSFQMGASILFTADSHFTASNRPTNIIFKTADSSLGERMRITSGGNVGIGTLNPTYKLDINGDLNIASSYHLLLGGTSVCSSSGCSSPSDRTLKENIQPLQSSLDKVLRLQGVEYDYKDKVKFTQQHQIGVIAQDIEKVFPEVVVKDSRTGLRSVAYDHLVAPLIESVKSLYHRLVGVEARQDEQQREIAALKAENTQLKERLEKLEARFK